jgi:4-amino-4-deoxychorismate lyase
LILINGIMEEKISTADRGLAYGDGIFRTLATKAGKPLFWPRHFARLADDCRRLDIPPPLESPLLNEVEQVARERDQGAVKIIVTRGPGERGYALPSNPQATRVVMGMPLPVWPPEYFSAGIRARLCDLRLSEQPRLAGIKHLNRLENVLARAEWDDPAIAEGLLLDQHSNLIEGVTSNLFLVRNGILITPDLSRCGVAGVTRERILAWAHKAGWVSEIRDVKLDELWDAEEILVCNSLIGVWQIREIRTAGDCGKTWESGRLTPLIRQSLEPALSAMDNLL